MNTNLLFRFVTRTFTTDYQVYGDRGEAVFSDLCEFAPLRQKGRFAPEDGGCVVLFEEEDHIFLTASGFNRQANDFVGRIIRFSFCQIFSSRQNAYTAFTKLICAWSDAEDKIQSLLQESPETQLQPASVFFDEEQFMDWLQEEAASFEDCTDVYVCTAEQTYPLEVSKDMLFWPEGGCFLKWTNSGPLYVTCDRIGSVEPLPYPDDKPHDKPQPKVWPSLSQVGALLLQTINDIRERVRDIKNWKIHKP